MNRAIPALLGVAILSGVALASYRDMFLPPDPLPGQPETAIVDITEGMTLRQVAELLARHRLVRSDWGFVALGKWSGVERRLPSGEYQLRAGMAPEAILQHLAGGHVLTHAVTIPEGYTVTQIADLLDAKGITDKEEFLRLAADPEFAKTLGVEAGSLEGYLFPNTYQFAKQSHAKTVIQAMVGELQKAVLPEWAARAAEIGMTFHQVLTLASVIEKETGVGAERPLISAVFHNRLRRHIPLQSDPTVIYGIPHFTGNLTRRDLETPTAYNTYRKAGLPPGPIASPGADSIHAALYPVPTSFLYFVSRNDGTHHFSATLAEHNKAVNYFQKRHGRMS